MSTKKLNIGEEKGFSFIEVLVALTILAVITVTFIPLLSNSFKLIFEAGRRSDATYNAHANMEDKLAKAETGDIFQLEMSFEKIEAPGTFVNVTVQGKKVKTTEPWGLNNEKEINYYTFYPE